MNTIKKTIGALQIVAMLWLCWMLPWPLIVLVVITHLGTIGRWLDRDEHRTHEGY